ncbi:MAG: 3-hydroxybutyryl-CoA dehydrogenase [Candidatus Kapabacteria bacterium]|nr:3-hydroxybutyryl-CoA dehydrogenase [Candidatus Kapabacteria bacterium]
MTTMKISICGAGTMGRGIALSCIQAGIDTVLYDSFGQAIETAHAYIQKQLQVAVEKQKMTPEQSETALGLLTVTSDFLAMKGSDFIIEAIIESREVKVEFFKRAEEECMGETTILATNTSSIAINSIARYLQKPERFVGLHFFNPAHIMKLVEIIRGVKTSEETVTRSIELSKKLGKQPAIAKDVPGFIVNRVARNYYNESQRIVTEGLATVEQVDNIMKSAGFKMGPFELMDLIGVDVNLDVTKSIYAQYFNEERLQPSLLQQQTVDAGLFGKKSGEGFYDYNKPTE